MLVIDAHQANEKRELKIEASSGLGGTYKLEVGGQSSGWSGTGTLEGESGTGDLSGFEGKGRVTAGSDLVKEVTTITGTLAVGQTLEGVTGVPNGTEVIEIVGSTAKLSANATAGAETLRTIRAGLTTVSGVSGGPFLAGHAIGGPGIQLGTTIASVGAGTLTLSKVPTDTATGAALITGSTTVGGLSGAVGHLSVGLLVSGPGIPAGTTIASVGAGEASFTLSKPPGSSGATSLSADLAFSAGETVVREAVEKLSPLAPGSVAVERLWLHLPGHPHARIQGPPRRLRLSRDLQRLGPDRHRALLHGDPDPGPGRRHPLPLALRRHPGPLRRPRHQRDRRQGRRPRPRLGRQLRPGLARMRRNPPEPLRIRRAGSSPGRGR